jgi:hypothetical protein
MPSGRGYSRRRAKLPTFVTRRAHLVATRRHPADGIHVAADDPKVAPSRAAGRKVESAATSGRGPLSRVADLKRPRGPGATEPLKREGLRHCDPSPTGLCWARGFARKYVAPVMGGASPGPLGKRSWRAWYSIRARSLASGFGPRLGWVAARSVDVAKEHPDSGPGGIRPRSCGRSCAGRHP